MSTAQETKINLLPPSEFELSFWGRFLKWAVTTGRYVIIVTELIVIVAFLSRFKLDSELAGLADEIRGKKNLLDAQSSVETKFLGVQSRLVQAEIIMGRALAAGGEIDAVVSTIPEGIKLTNLSVGKATIVLDANAIGSFDTGAMLGLMSRSGRWKSVDVTGLTSDALKGINLSVSLKR